MIDLLKKLFEQRRKEITVMLLDDSQPGEDNSFKLIPNSIFGIFFTIFLIMVVVIAATFMITPLGELLYNSDEAEIREQIMQITDKTLALEDSLKKRDTQLQEMKNIIRLSVDTTLAMDQRFDQLFSESQSMNSGEFISMDQSVSIEKLSQNEILFSNVSKTIPDFPGRYPVRGSLTRGYLPDQEHYGIDIATGIDEPVVNIADGSVFTSSWTINNGYVISIQHGNGVVTTFKHLARLNKREGDLVLKGDILGSSGDAGVLSTGPHLHLEVWKNGVPQNPELYLIN